MSDGWVILSGPVEWRRPGHRDEVAWKYHVAKSVAESGAVVFAMTGTAVSMAEAGSDPEIEDAFRSQGLLIVREALSRDPRPTTIVMDSMGRLTYTP